MISVFIDIGFIWIKGVVFEVIDDFYIDVRNYVLFLMILYYLVEGFFLVLNKVLDVCDVWLMLVLGEINIDYFFFVKGGFVVVVIGLVLSIIFELVKVIVYFVGVKVLQYFVYNLNKLDVWVLEVFFFDILLFIGGIDGGDYDYGLLNVKLLV